jgi:branched-chain amino acid transport system ATP-binding protein
MLEISNLSVRYGRHQALDGVSARIGKGEICVILGANGAGKSSLLKAVAGMVKVEPGSEIAMNGRAITGMKPHRIVELGIALVPEGRGVFGELTVAENLQLGAFCRRARSGENEALQRVYALFPRLAERRSQVVRTMSGGEQQMVAIGRALMSNPEILMLDEPSLGRSPILTKELFRSLTAIARTGVGILLVEQNARQSLKIAERGCLIENGRITGEGSANSLTHDPAVIDAYLGGAARRRHKPARLPPPFVLPVGLGAIGRFVGDLAARAGAIRAAFVRALRQQDPLPSAFAGRYNPASAGDPWEDLIRTAPQGLSGQPHISADGRRLSEQAASFARAASERYALYIRTGRLAPGPSPYLDPAALARAAAERMAEHVRRQRTARPLPSALAPGPPPYPDPASLAQAAAQRLAEHVRRQRTARPLPSAFAPSELARQDDAQPNIPLPVKRIHGELGHNSAGIVDAEPPQPMPIPDSAALAARAAAISAEHVAERRKLLTMGILRRPTLVK